jgi:hypothetical protein
MHEEATSDEDVGECYERNAVREVVEDVPHNDPPRTQPPRQPPAERLSDGQRMRVETTDITWNANS